MFAPQIPSQISDKRLPSKFSEYNRENSILLRCEQFWPKQNTLEINKLNKCGVGNYTQCAFNIQIGLNTKNVIPQIIWPVKMSIRVLSGRQISGERVLSGRKFRR